MKKVFFISAVLALMLCGCTVKDEITQENAENYLSQLYNRKFSLSDSYENNGNICYTFTDEEGVQCHFCIESFNIPTSTGKNQVSYRISEDYQVMYLKAHPEIYQALSDMDMIPTWNEGDNMINSVRFSFRYDTYEDIESLVNDVSETVLSVPKITSADNIINPPEVYSECAVMDFYCPYLSENSDVEMYFPMINKYVEMQNAEDIISQLQEHFNSEGVEYDDSWQKTYDFSTVPENYKFSEVKPFDPDEHRQEQQAENYYEDEWSEYGYYDESYDDYGYYY